MLVVLLLLPPLQLRHQLRVLQGRLARLIRVAAAAAPSSVTPAAGASPAAGLLLPVPHVDVGGLHVVALLSRAAVSLAHSLLLVHA